MMRTSCTCQQWLVVCCYLLYRSMSRSVSITPGYNNLGQVINNVSQKLNTEA